MSYIWHYQSPLGGITLGSFGEGLSGLWFDGQKYELAGLNGPIREERLPVFEQAERWLDVYFSGREPSFTPPLSIQTTAFRKAVWDTLLSIPYGQTVTYGEIAAKIARALNLPRSSPRAVGGAVGRNPISLIIPCHRVVGAGGSLTGYAGGIERKRYLLALEGAVR